MFRAQAIKEIGGFDESFYRHQDYEILLRYFAAGNIIGAIQTPVSEFGRNDGENIPKGDRLEEIKSKFLATFDSYIKEFNSLTPGYMDSVYASQYSGVFLGYLKNKEISKAWKIMRRYAFKSPLFFWQPILRNLKKHILHSC